MASAKVLSNPIVQVALALVVILVIATLTFASAISGALTKRKQAFLLSIAEGSKETLILQICCHCRRFAGLNRSNLGFEAVRWKVTLL